MEPINFSKEVKIKIPQKEVIDQKCELQLLLNKIFVDKDGYSCIVCEKTFDWMRTPHWEKSPKELTGSFKKLFNALKSYRNQDEKFAKKDYQLRCDFVSDYHKVIVEYDERQHFSMARKVSLESYKDIPVDFDRDLWIRACTEVQARDNEPKYRDEGRAYLDSVRDILAQKNGYKLYRIMHGQFDLSSSNALRDLKKYLRIK